jgi:hypothetical protein
MTLRSSSAAALAAVAAAAAVPAAAQGASIATDAPCYLAGSPMGISGTMFTPGARWTVETEQLFAFGDVDPTGGWSATETAPSLGAMIGPGRKTFNLVAKENQVEVARTQFSVTNLAASISPQRGRPTGTGRWKFSGFTPGRAIYVHVRRGGKTLGNYRFGVAKGTCGELTARARRLPIKRSRIRSGTYTLVFDNARTYRRTSRPQVSYTTTVFTTFR